MRREYFFEAFGAWAASRLTQEERARETRYGRIVNYIDKERYAGLRPDLYDHYGNAIKRMLASRAELVDVVWMAQSATMMHLITDRLSNPRPSGVIACMETEPRWIAGSFPAAAV